MDLNNPTLFRLVFLQNMLPIKRRHPFILSLVLHHCAGFKLLLTSILRDALLIKIGLQPCSYRFWTVDFKCPVPSFSSRRTLSISFRWSSISRLFC